MPAEDLRGLRLSGASGLPAADLVVLDPGGPGGLIGGLRHVRRLSSAQGQDGDFGYSGEYGDSGYSGEYGASEGARHRPAPPPLPSGGRFSGRRRESDLPDEGEPSGSSGCSSAAGAGAGASGCDHGRGLLLQRLREIRLDVSLRAVHPRRRVSGLRGERCDGRRLLSGSGSSFLVLRSSGNRLPRGAPGLRGPPGDSPRNALPGRLSGGVLL